VSEGEKAAMMLKTTNESGAEARALSAASDHREASGLADRYLDIGRLSAYSGISERKLRDLLRDPFHPLPHYRVGRSIKVRVSEFDVWMRAHCRQDTSAHVNGIVNSVLAGLVTA